MLIIILQHLNLSPKNEYESKQNCSLAVNDVNGIDVGHG